ncbi:MAG: TonB-dependent receptor [Niabella sp.]
MKRLIYIFLVFFLSVSVSVTARNMDNKGSLTGVVTDAATGKPLANATVTIHELKTWVTTDNGGRYNFTSLPNGSFTIEVSYVGYKSFVDRIKLDGNTTRDFTLRTAIVENDNVTVTGVSAVTQVRQTPTYTTIVNQKELQRASGTNLMDILSKQPGVSAVTTGPAIAKPFIRGMGYNRVVTINDGVRQEGQQWGDEHGMEIDEYSTKRVEILRGPASLMYGSDALGGVVNIITNTPVALNTVSGQLSGSMNANNNMWGGYANIAGNLNGFNWNAYGSLKRAGDYQNKYDGDVLNSRFNEKNFGGYVGLNKSWGYSHLVFSRFNQQIGMVDGVRDDEGNLVVDGYDLTDKLRDGKSPLVPYQRVNHTKLLLDNAFSLLNGARLTALVGYQQSKRREFGEVDAPKEPGAYFDLKTVNYHVAYHFASNGNWKTSVGVNGMGQTNKNKGEEAIIPDYDLFDVGVYGYTAYHKEGTTVSGGLRFDNRSFNGKQMMEEEDVKFEAFKKQFSNISASVGLSQELGEHLLLKANLSRGFRAPNAAEMASNGEHEGTGHYEIGNRDLKSESSLSFDMGLQFNTQHVDFSVTPYINHVQNYIYAQKLQGVGGLDSLIGDAKVYKFTQQSANLLGLEASLDIHPHPLDWLHFENTFSMVQGRFTKAVDGSENLPLMMPARLLTELRAEFPNQVKDFKNLFVKVEMDNVAKQNHYFAGYNTETATKGYTLFNAALGTDLEVRGKTYATLVLALNNLTDVAYQNHLSRLKYTDENPVTGRVGVFNMGRNFTARLIVPLKFK